MRKYKLTVCGGTFDTLHKGHKDFLKKILQVSEKVFLGLTSDNYIQNHKSNRGITPYDTRKKELVSFLKEINAEERVEIQSIDDMYGPLLDPNFKADALVVTANSYKSALEINSKRKKNSLPVLQIIKIPITKDSKGKTLSTTRIKQGYINRIGKFILPSDLRKKLHKPFGELIKDVPDNLDESKIITVGDVTTEKFIDSNLKPRLSIVDFLVNRKPIPHKDFENSETIGVNNPAGTISYELFESIQNCFKDSLRKVLIVNGEEDLSVLPVLISAPIGSFVFYGQPNRGLVKVKVNRRNKKRAHQLLKKFSLESK